MAKKGKGKGKEKGGKGKGKGKGKKGAEPEPEPKDPLKEFKRFAETYEVACRSYAVPPLESVLDQIKKWRNPNEDGEVVLSPFFVCADPRLDALHTKAIAETLQEFDHIRQVAFFAAAVSDEGLTTLVDVIKTNKLRSLELVNAAVHAPGMQVLSNVLRTNASLKSLTLDHNQLGNDGARALVSELRWNFGLTVLSLKYCEIGPEGAAAIGTFLLGSAQSKVQNLSLQGNPLGDKGLIGLAGRPDGTTSWVDAEMPDTASKGLMANKHLTELDLRDVQLSAIEESGMRALGNMLQVNATLGTIDLRMNQLGDLAGQILIQTLPPLGTATAIKYIHLSERMEKQLFDGVYAALADNRGGGKGKKGKKGKGGKKGGKKVSDSILPSPTTCSKW